VDETLDSDFNATQFKFPAVTGLISRFQQSWSKRFMHFDRGANDLIGQPIRPFLGVYLKLLCALCVFVVS
jgi:hypothetical protein